LGDPAAFAAMEKIPFDHGPSAIVSSIMHLSTEQASSLQSRYGCPILDLYAMTEAGIISVGEPRGHRILPHDLFVEILDENDRRCPPGVRGEITLSGGRNPFLPLLRYRTGDWGALGLIDGQRYLLDFVGRQPVEYATHSGRIVHSMELTRLMRRHPVRRYEMNATPAGGYDLTLAGRIDLPSLRSDLEHLFGKTPIRIINESV
jgi:phenylacetate-CoA ligase